MLEGKDPQNGTRDYDFYYFDEDTSYEAEDEVIRRAEELFRGMDAEIEVRNEARVHIWYEEHFGVPAIPFTSSTDAIDHFAAKTCCFAFTRDARGQIATHAPHGFADLFARKIVPNPVLAPREVYEAKIKRWLLQWPSLTAEPWPEPEASTNIIEG